MIRGLVIDDEALARQHLVRLLASHPDVHVIGEAGNGVDALERIAEQQPNVIFLDIEMPGLNGFDMLAQLARPPVVVFATAYDEYAIRGFEVNAVDYLLKPIQPIRLAKTLDKLRATLLHPNPEYESSLKRLISSLRPEAKSKLAARRGKRIFLLSPHDVLYAAVEDQIVFLHTQTERFSSDRTIAELEKLLIPAGFVRIGRSAIVNLEHARELLPWVSGTCKLKLSNGVELPVSRDRSRDLKAKLQVRAR